MTIIACEICGSPSLNHRPSRSLHAFCSRKCSGEFHMKHDGNGTRLYSIWKNMKSRCFNPKAKQFKDYGGRGISVCEEWSKCFLTFRKWALSNGYADNLEIDRRDNEGSYSPNNCWWVTHQFNSSHKRNSVVNDDLSKKAFDLVAQGVIQKEVCLLLGITKSSLWRALTRARSVRVVCEDRKLVVTSKEIDLP
jgi:hypothetical protein